MILWIHKGRDEAANEVRSVVQSPTILRHHHAGHGGVFIMTEASLRLSLEIVSVVQIQICDHIFRYFFLSKSFKHLILVLGTVLKIRAILAQQ